MRNLSTPLPKAGRNYFKGRLAAIRKGNTGMIAQSVQQRGKIPGTGSNGKPDLHTPTHAEDAAAVNP